MYQSSFFLSSERIIVFLHIFSLLTFLYLPRPENYKTHPFRCVFYIFSTIASLNKLALAPHSLQLSDHIQTPKWRFDPQNTFIFAQESNGELDCRSKSETSEKDVRPALYPEFLLRGKRKWEEEKNQIRFEEALPTLRADSVWVEVVASAERRQTRIAC